jgi:hypothetical protein
MWHEVGNLHGFQLFCFKVMKMVAFVW